MPSKPSPEEVDPPGLAEASPHYHGHRERLRARFLDAGSDAVTEYELLELLLFRAIPRRDVKPLAKTLIAKFGSFAEVVSAPPARLREVEGLGEAAIGELKIVQAAASRLARGQVKKRPILSSWSTVLDYCRTTMAFADKEQFRIIFLDKRNQVIADEIQQIGTVDHTPVYPREVVKRALELSATAIILVHNHPSGDPTPSRADLHMTHHNLEVAKPLGIVAKPINRTFLGILTFLKFLCFTLSGRSLPECTGSIQSCATKTMTVAVHRSMPILLVEDFATMIRIMRKLLEQIGFTDIDDAADGAAAVARLREKKYSLVISDWNMEPMTGLDLLKHIRSDPGLAKMPVILVTADANIANVIAAKNAGVDSYIVKPFDAQSLSVKIEQAFGASPKD